MLGLQRATQQVFLCVFISTVMNEYKHMHMSIITPLYTHSSHITTPQNHLKLVQTHGDSPPLSGPQRVTNQQTKQPREGPETGPQQHLPCKPHFVCFSINAGPEVQALREKRP